MCKQDQNKVCHVKDLLFGELEGVCGLYWDVVKKRCRKSRLMVWVLGQ